MAAAAQGIDHFFNTGLDFSGKPAPVGGGSITNLVKQLSPADLLLQRLVRQRPKDGEETEAEAIWGQPSDFTFADKYQAGDDDVGVLWNDDDATHLEVPIATIEFQEVDREEEDVRVENPDDPDQYVIVARAKTITIKGPDLRPTETLTGVLVYDDTIEGSIQRIQDGIAASLGEPLTHTGIPKITRPPYAFYKITFKYPGTS